MNLTSADIDRLTAAFLAIAPVPSALSPPDGYADLPLCIVDSIFSMNAHYTGTRRAVSAYAQHAGVGVRPWPAGISQGGEHTLTEMRQNLSEPDPDRLADTVFANRAVASGTRKAVLVRLAVDALLRVGVDKSADLASDSVSDDYARQKGAWTGVHGLGPATFRYLRLLAGLEDVKPDRMIIRWVTNALERPTDVSPTFAGQALVDLTGALARHNGEPVSQRTVDYAVWQWQSGRLT